MVLLSSLVTGSPDFRHIIANLMIVRLTLEFAINLLTDYYQFTTRFFTTRFVAKLVISFATRLLPDLLPNSHQFCYQINTDLSPNSSSVLLPDYYQICHQTRHQFCYQITTRLSPNSSPVFQFSIIRTILSNFVSFLHNILSILHFLVF